MIKRLSAPEFNDDPNFLKYLEDYQTNRLTHLEEKFIAYQSQKIVCIGQDRELVTEKVKGILSLHNEPILLIKISKDNVYIIK